MFIIKATDILYKEPVDANADLPKELTLGVEEPIDNSYLDSELILHIEELVGHPVESLHYSWTYDPNAATQ